MGDIKARIKEEHGMWVGQIYGRWENYLTGTSWKGWETVTERCFTRIGARIELQSWKSKNVPKEFNI